MEIVVLLWALCGAIGHIRQAREMKTYCGTPIWKDIGTYMMFVPAMVAGPIILLAFERYPERCS